MFVTAEEFISNSFCLWCATLLFSPQQHARSKLRCHIHNAEIKNGPKAVAEEKQEHPGADLKDVKKMKYADLGSKTTKKKNTTRNDKYLKAINTKKGEEFWVVQEVVNL